LLQPARPLRAPRARTAYALETAPLTANRGAAIGPPKAAFECPFYGKTWTLLVALLQQETSPFFTAATPS